MIYTIFLRKRSYPEALRVIRTRQEELIGEEEMRREEEK